MAIKFFDCFAGIGGFRSGLENAGGFECVGFCEIDKYAAAAYKAMYDTKGEDFYGDITKINTENLKDFDLLVGGFPCQPFSNAGRRLSFADPRGTLFFELARILEAKRPRYFIFENVPGLLSAQEGYCFAKIIDTLCELGYSVCWRVLDSKNFGVRQSRRRVFIVGYFGERSPLEILAFGTQYKKDLRMLINGGSQGSRVYLTSGDAVTQCSRGRFDARRPCRALATASQRRVAGSGGGGGKTGLYLIDQNPNPQITDNARCITARQDSGVSNHRGEHSAVLVEEPQPIINPFKETTWQNGRRIKAPGEPMFTITVTDRHGIVHCGRIRRLMPIECWRLQGFTDEQFHKVEALGMSDAQLYKQAGNAVTTKVIEAIGRRLKAFDEKYGG
ncbi:MAG: DNA (cytosine-5-)-methyltransferase [Ruminococcaceae bacterium]|nr:DNA (cytosine-5-)-methyltransferase [Oscillospiraceae bacterium]